MSIETFYSRSSLTSAFGDGRNGGRKHRGVDFSHSAKPGTVDVPALLGGTVISELNPASWHGFGYQVTIESSYAGKTVRLSYAHLSAASPLRVGQQVSAGTIVGREGRTGSTTGSCVHIELYIVGQGFINPAPTIEAIRSRASAPAVKNITVNRSVVEVQRVVGVSQDGIYGLKTKAAVKAFQKSHGLTADGIWGPKTDAVAFPKPSASSTSSVVRAAQQKLKSNYPLYAGSLVVDGIQGPKTTAAVKEFQRRSGLVADGIIGPKTRRALGI